MERKRERERERDDKKSDQIKKTRKTHAYVCYFLHYLSKKKKLKISLFI